MAALSCVELRFVCVSWVPIWWVWPFRTSESRNRTVTRYTTILSAYTQMGSLSNSDVSEFCTIQVSTSWSASSAPTLFVIFPISTFVDKFVDTWLADATGESCIPASRKALQGLSRIFTLLSFWRDFQVPRFGRIGDILCQFARVAHVTASSLLSLALGCHLHREWPTRDPFWDDSRPFSERGLYDMKRCN